MKKRRLLIGSTVILVTGLLLGLGWRWYATPVPPTIEMDGMAQGVADAIESALRAVRSQPRSGEAWGSLGKILVANGFEKQGIACLVHAERFDPHNPQWPYLRGVQFLTDSPGEGIPLLRRALSLAQTPEPQVAILFRLTLVLIEDGQLGEGEQHLMALRGIEGASPRFHFAMGLLDIARKDSASARTHLSNLTDLPFARKQVFGLLATLTDGDRELARTYEQQAARLPPDIGWPDPLEGSLKSYKVERITSLGHFHELEAQGRREEALDYLRKAVSASPDAEGGFVLGYTLYTRNELEEAEEALRSATRYHPQKAKTYFFLGAALFGRGEKRYREPSTRGHALELFRQAVVAEDQALVLQPGFGDAHLLRGLALKYLGHSGESLQALGQAVRYRPESADAHRHLGEGLAEAGKIREGLKHLENAVQLANPGDRRPQETLAKWQARAKTSTPAPQK